MEDAVNLPSRIVDISSPLDNETVMDHPFMRPKIEYRTNAQNAPMLLENFPGLNQEDLPGGEGWAFEIVTITTHNGTHMDAPVHFQSTSIDGKRMMSIDEVPLDWFFRPMSSSTSANCQTVMSSRPQKWRQSFSALATS
jgi:kynurenine formamidase